MDFRQQDMPVPRIKGLVHPGPIFRSRIAYGRGMKCDPPPRWPKGGYTYKRYGGTELTKIATKMLAADVLRPSLTKWRVIVKASNVTWPVVARMKAA